MQITEVGGRLESLAEDFAENVEAINGEIRSFSEAVKAAEDEKRDLTIAIVGRVKSGKSSFLNALLFNGDDVLPHAATPMTAALTFIRYDETCHAEVEFFSAADWERFKKAKERYDVRKEEVRRLLEEDENRAEQRAKRDRRPYSRREVTEERINERLSGEIGEDILSAIELVGMASKSGMDVESCLGGKKRIDVRAGLAPGEAAVELSKGLEEYVGAGGSYTPIVCSTTIYLSDPALKGYCIIDTPGTNDPVISRGKKTQDNLKKADVVLVMSPASRFFDESDLVLCSQNLPSNGIKNFLILISQFDVVIGEVEGTIDPSLPPAQRLMAAMAKSRRDLVSRFKRCIGGIRERACAGNAVDSEKWERLERKDPICVSAQAFVLASHWDRLSEKEKSYLANFDRLIPGFNFDRDTLMDFSFMHCVTKEFDLVKAEKAATLAERKKSLSATARKRVLELLGEFRDSVAQKIKALETSDVATLEKDFKRQKKLVEGLRSNVESIFSDAIYTASDRFANVVSELRSAKTSYAALNVGEKTHQGSELNRVERGGLIGGLIDDFFGPKVVTRYYTYTTRYASTYEAVDAVEAFAEKARRMLEKQIREAVDVRDVQRKIAAVTLDAIDSGAGDDFDDLRNKIRQALRSVTIPDADFGDVDYTADITGAFSGGRVEDAEVDLLKNAQREALQSVVKDLEAKARKTMKAIETTLEKARDTFIDGIIGGLEDGTRQLVEALNDKRANCDRWKGHVSVLDATIRALS